MLILRILLYLWSSLFLILSSFLSLTLWYMRYLTICSLYSCSFLTLHISMLWNVSCSARSTVRPRDAPCVFVARTVFNAKKEITVSQWNSVGKTRWKLVDAAGRSRPRRFPVVVVFFSMYVLLLFSGWFACALIDNKVALIWQRSVVVVLGIPGGHMCA